MRQFNQAFQKFAPLKSKNRLTFCLSLLALFHPFLANAQLYSGYTPNFGFDKSYATLRSLVEAGTNPTETSTDGQSISLSWAEPAAGGSIGAAMKAMSSSAASCSTHTTAPSNAQSLSNGSYTYVVTGSSSGTIWGTGTYTDDSPIARAAVHAGHVAVGAKAVIRLTKSGGRPSYTGSTRNGVTSSNYGSWSGSYSMTYVSACSTSTTPPTTTPPTNTPTGSCSTYTTAPGTAQSLSNGTHTYVVTGSSSGTIWGTGTYTDDSPVARAAVHAGHVAVGAKAVIRLTKSGGRSSYTGSTRNGVTSSNYGSWSGSYSMTFVKSCSTSTTPPTTTPPTTTPPTTTPPTTTPSGSCSTYTTAPSTAQSLSNGTYTYAVTGSSSGTIWGTGTYTDDSPVARAAVHAGHVAVGAKAVIRLTKSGGRSSYTGSTRNGVTSSNYGSWSGSYSMTFVKSCSTSTTPPTTTPPTTTPPTTTPPTTTPSGSCSTYTTAPSTAQSLSNGTYTYAVTGSSSGTIWGTGTYTDDSPVARAAVHAGHVAVGAKAVIRLTKSGGRSSYTGSTRNGVTSSGYGSWTGSYTMTFVKSCSTSNAPTTPATDTDGDDIPDSTDTDDDNDGMPDTWELEHQLNPLNAGDAAQDADNDSYNNLAEFTAGSDPNWNLSKPGSIPVLAAGFDSGYTVQRGLINNDQLQDLLIRNPTSGILPAVSDFVLIQHAAGGFSLESAAGHTIPSGLTPINSAIRLHDLNADGVTDMLLHGLDGYIDGAGDQIVYANYSEMYVIPGSHVGLGAEVKRFFSDLADWIDDADHFRDEAQVTGAFQISTSTTGLPVRNGYTTHGQLNLTGAMLTSHLGKCIGLSPTLCYIVSNNGFIDSLSDSLFDELLMVWRAALQIAVYVDPDLREIPATVFVYDFAGTDQTAVLLVANYLGPIRDTGTMDRGSTAAVAVSEALEGMLNSPVFAGGLKSANSGVFPEIGGYSSYEDIVRDILKVFEYVLARITPPCDPDETNNCGGTSPIVIPPPSDTPDPVIEITKSSAGDLTINRDPSMPAATFQASVSGLQGDGYAVTYQWHASLSYRGVSQRKITDRNGNEEWVDGTVHQFTRRIPTVGGLPGTVGPSVFSNYWTVPWGGVLMGGNLTVNVTARITAGGTEIATVSDSETYAVNGSNPTLANMKEITGESVEKLAVAWEETMHRQFTGVRYTGTGTPVFGRPDGWGIMQLDNIPGFTRTEAHFWNWRVNLQKGTDYLDEIHSGAVNWLKGFYDIDDPLDEGRSTGANHPWGWSPYEIATDATAKNNVWDDVFSRYNSGRHLYSPNGNNGETLCDDDDPDDTERELLGCAYKTKVRGFVNTTPW